MGVILEGIRCLEAFRKEDLFSHGRNMYKGSTSLKKMLSISRGVFVLGASLQNANLRRSALYAK